jgi:hypothetical protein
VDQTLALRGLANRLRIRQHGRCPVPRPTAEIGWADLRR